MILLVSRATKRLLKDAGFTLKVITGHLQFEKGTVKIAVPNHKGDLKPHEAAHIRAAIRKAEA